ncbi:helix-turn-helix transcriptional regulator [Pantoea sp. B65]|uniref:helix-turn-helix transcriptional regulator n=1 Tax=Pantoea sp. B65 TaxID=2813359 RepID=UPI0039B68226
MFWDPGSCSLKQQYQDAVRLLPQLKARQQRLFLTVDWQVQHDWLVEGMVYQEISVVEQSRLLFSLDEIMALGIEHPERCLADTGGWPVLVANYDRLTQPLFRRSWQDFIAARIISLLPLRLQRILLALALSPSLTMQKHHLDGLAIGSLLPLIYCDNENRLHLGNAPLRQALVALAAEERSLYQGAMRLVAQDLWQQQRRFQAIITAAQSNNVDLALNWFHQSGSGLYGHLHGFSELKNILQSFPAASVAQETSLAWARIEELLKAGELMAARAFCNNSALFHLGNLNRRQKALMRLMQLTLMSYQSENYSDATLDSMRSLAPLLADEPLACASLHNKLAIAHMTRGEWQQARVCCHISLAGYRQASADYLCFFAHFHLCRLACHQGALPQARQQIALAENCLQRVPFRQSLTCERAFIALGKSLLALHSGDIDEAAQQWRHVRMAMDGLECWPELMAEFSWLSLLVCYLKEGLPAAWMTLQDLRTRYAVSFPAADDSLLVLYELFLKQEGGQWREAHQCLLQLKIPAHAPLAQRFSHWLTLRAEVALLAQRHHSRGIKSPEFVAESRLTAVEIQLQRLLQARFYVITQQTDKLRECWLLLVNEAQYTGLNLPLLLERNTVAEVWEQLSADPRRTIAGADLVQRLQRQTPVTLSEKTVIPPGLTTKQWLILQRLSEGLSNKQIANLSGISENTVKFHLKALFRYFAVTKRSQLIERLQQQADDLSA